MTYENQETVSSQRYEQHHTMHGFLTWLAIVAGIIVIGIAAYGIYLVKQYIPYVGFVWIICSAILPTLGIVYLIVMVIRYVMKVETIHIAETGTILRTFIGKQTMYHPLGLQEFRAHGTKEHKEQETIHVPELLTVLRDGLLGSVELMLGYHVDGTPRFGTWDDLRTFVVAGKSRSGKTVTMVFFIVQALIANATVYVCDPHYSKKTGLLKVIEPLLPFLHVARTDVEIIQMVTEFLNEMRSRVNGTSQTIDVPMLLVIDEWSKLLRDLDNVEIDLLVNCVLGCAEEYAGYNGYAMIAGHEWTARESGGKKGAAIRRAFHSVFVHRLDEDYAKFLLTGKNKRMAKTAPNLPTGNAHFQDSEGELDYLIIPYYGAKKEGIYEVVEMLKAINAPSSRKYINAPSPDDTYMPTLQPVNRNDMAYIPAPLIEKLQETNNQVVLTTDEDKVRYIQRLRKRNIAHRDIAYMFGLYGPRYDEYQTFCEKYKLFDKEVPEKVKQ